MIKDIIEFYRIGKELGLTNKEMKNILFFNRKKFYSYIFQIVVLIMLVLWVITIFILQIEISRNTYPAGAGYSSVRMKDFKTKMRKFFNSK